MRIIALDPGGTTGYAIHDTEAKSWTQGELKGQHHSSLWDLLEKTRADVVIYERFQYQRRELDKGVSLVLDSVEYIGVIKLWHQTSNSWQDYKPTLIEQTPAQAKNLWTDDKLVKVGLRSNSPHSRDATRHLLYYLTVTLGQREWIMKTKPQADRPAS